MPERPEVPKEDMKPAWRAAALAYRAERACGAGDHAAHGKAIEAVQVVHPELGWKEASAVVVKAVAYVTRFHSEWFWSPLKVVMERTRQAGA
jgi:hypothetical protein